MKHQRLTLRKTVVFESGDRITIHTDPRRASAILQVLAGGTLQEVGDGLGVSRERIRQFLNEAGLTTKDRQRQTGDSAAQQTLRRRFTRVRRRRQRAQARQRARFQELATWIREFAAQAGRSPTIWEVAAARWPGVTKNAVGPRLAGYLSRHTPRRKCFRRYTKLLYQMARVEPRGYAANGVNFATWRATVTAEQQRASTRRRLETRALNRALHLSPEAKRLVVPTGETR